MQSVEFSAGPRGPLLPGSGNAPMQCPSQVSLNQGPSQVHGVDPRLLGGLSPGLGTMTMHNQMQIPLSPGPVKARARCSRVLVWDQVWACHTQGVLVCSCAGSRPRSRSSLSGVRAPSLSCYGFKKFRGLRALGMFRIDPFQSHRSGELRNSLLESLVNGARPMSAAMHSR